MKILMVCLGNICRSPLAEGIMRGKLPESFTVDSAGTISQHEGELPDSRAIDTAKKYGVDIQMQRSRPIQPSDLENFDRIYCMDLNNYEAVISMAQNDAQREKIALIRVAAGEAGEDIEVPDPYFGGQEGFDRVFKMLDDACQKIAAKLLSTTQ